jgi:hypothetical protein
MPDPQLRRAEATRVFERLPAVVEHICKNALVGPRELVAGFIGFAFGKRGFGAEPSFDISPPPLNEVGNERLAIEPFAWITIEAWIKQAQ